MIFDIWQKLKRTDKPVLIYGTGNGADKIINELERLNIKISGVFAGEGFVRNRDFRGFHVMSYNEAREKFGDFTALLSFGTSRPEVLRTIKQIKESHELYSVDVPVYGDNIFNAEFYEKHIEEINRVKALLSDKLSEKVYENVIRFKLTGETELLFGCETDRREAFENILKLSDNETYFDGGAFTGDTVEEFIKNVNSYKKIYAAEPDSKNFKKLESNCEKYENVCCLNAALWDKKGELHFSGGGGRSGSISENGKTVKCETIDGITGGKEITYIKLDVEGMEKEAVTGAAETIKKYKPKMLVSCYHRSEDIFSLPLQIMEIRDDYKVYIRHNPYLPAWDTQFYFI